VEYSEFQRECKESKEHIFNLQRQFHLAEEINRNVNEIAMSLPITATIDKRVSSSQQTVQINPVCDQSSMALLFVLHYKDMLIKLVS
jgi:hypothetical protein